MANNNVIQEKKFIYDDCQKRIDRSWNAQINYFQFFAMINLAYIGAIFFLFQKKFLDELNLLSWIISFINISIFLIYIREHHARDDNEKQINKIINKENLKKRDWYLFNDNFIDIYRGLM